MKLQLMVRAKHQCGRYNSQDSHGSQRVLESLAETGQQSLFCYLEI